MKELNFSTSEVQTKLASKIAILEVQLANEQAAKQAIVKYAESLEKKIEELEGQSK